MKDREQFMKSWKIKQQRGKLNYVLISAASVGSYGLLGLIIGSLFLYNSPSEYSFTYYLPKYIYLFFGLSLIAAPHYIYQWNRNEEKYSKLLDIHGQKL